MVSGRVESWNAGGLGIGNADEPQRGVSTWRRQLTLERQQTAANHIGLRCVELVCQTLQALAFIRNEVNL